MSRTEQVRVALSTAALALSVLACVVSVTTPAAAQHSVGNHFKILDGDVPAAGMFTVELLLSNDTYLEGFQTSITWDHTEIELAKVTGVGTDAADLMTAANPSISAGNEPFEFFWPGTPVEIPGTQRSRLISGFVFDYVPPYSNADLPPGHDRSVLRLTFHVVGGASGAQTEILFDTALGANFVIIGGFSIDGTLDHGWLTFVDTFRRGDANGDGVVNVQDAVFLLNYLYNHGSAPTCFDAADSNDDGNPAGINTADIVHILDYLFGGHAALPSPFGQCGVDPTADAWGCAAIGGSCP